MPPTINIRPVEINLDFYPGSPIVLTFNFPAGYLATVVFKTYLGGRVSPGVEGTCVGATDTLTVTFTASQTDDFDLPMPWELDLFDSSPDPDSYIPQFVGTWTPGTEGNQGPVTAEFDVTIPAAVVVNVTSANIPGPQGDPGATGAGVPVGGATGEALVKNSGTDYDTGWAVAGNPTTIIDTDGIWQGSSLATADDATDQAALISEATNGTIYTQVTTYVSATETGHTISPNANPGIVVLDDGVLKMGFYGQTPVALQTGVTVDAAGIHAALVALGLFTA